MASGIVLESNSLRPARYLFQGKVRVTAPCSSDPRGIKWIKQFARPLLVLEAACTALESSVLAHLSGDPEGFPVLKGFQSEVRKGSTAESKHSLWNFERFPSDNTLTSNTYMKLFLFKDNFLYWSLFKIVKYSNNNKYMILSIQDFSPLWLCHLSQKSNFRKDQNLWKWRVVYATNLFWM